MSRELVITEDPIDAERHVLAVCGEIDQFTGPALKRAITACVADGRSRIVVDLTQTTFLDSSALGVLIGAVRHVRDRGGALAIVNVDAGSAKTFQLTGLDQILTIVATREEAVQAVG